MAMGQHPKRRPERARTVDRPPHVDGAALSVVNRTDAAGRRKGGKGSKEKRAAAFRLLKEKQALATAEAALETYDSLKKGRQKAELRPRNELRPRTRLHSRAPSRGRRSSAASSRDPGTAPSASSRDPGTASAAPSRDSGTESTKRQKLRLRSRCLVYTSDAAAEEAGVATAAR